MKNLHGWSRRAKIRSVSLLAAAFVVTGGLAIQGHARAAAYRHLMENGYQHAFAELVTAVSELDIALQKQLYATSPALFSSLSTEIFGKAMSAQMALGELPYGNVELEQTASFLAKTGDYVMALSRTAASGGCSSGDRETLRGLSVGVTALNQKLQGLQADLQTGEISLQDLQAVQDRLSQETEDGAQDLAGSSFQTIEQDFPEVPALIYDGPFSEHIAGQRPRMLEGQGEVTQEEAQAAAARFLSLRPEIFDLAAEGAGRIPTWGFSAAVDGGELYVEVSKQGGLVLEVLSSRPVGEATLSREQAVAAAARFLEERGFPGMQESYTIEQSGVLTVNFAATQGDVLCYPDLIKVSVALDNGRVIGFESEGYLMNHTTRDLSTPAVTEQAAREQVAPDLEVLSRQLTLIPTGGAYEVLCHEFKCQTQDGTHYIIYVNAQTGQQEKILLLLEDETGVLAI